MNSGISMRRGRGITLHCTGITLIELLVVMAIIGILAAIAYPSYTSYVHTAHRTDATSTLLQDAQVLQRCYTQNGQNGLGYTYSSASCPVQAGSSGSPGGYYQITVQIPAPSLPAPSYEIDAVPAAGSPQAADTQCARFALLSNGAQSALNSSNADSTSTCWGAH